MVASAVANVKTPKMMVASASMRLRPNRSPSGPNVSAPIAAPSSAEENSGPSAARVSLMLSAMIGAATAIDCVSAPSRNATRAQRAIANT